MLITNEKTQKCTVLRGPFTCDTCGVIFHKYIGPKQAKDVKVCSRKCFPAYFKKVCPAKGEDRDCLKCGKTFFVNFAKDDRRGKKRKYCSRECNTKYGGGKWITYDGYWCLCINGKEIKEHRHIMQEFIGRKLLATEIVHHKNGEKLDNRIENLEITDRRTHNHIHNHKHGKYVTMPCTCV